MRSALRCLLLACLSCQVLAATTVSDAPLRALNAYIEQNGSCSEQVVEWNRTYSPKAIAGETSRSFYYRVLGYQDWGRCGRPFFRPILTELQKVWAIYAKGRVSKAEFEAKEAELVNLWFAALRDDERGEQMVQDYEARTASQLIGQIPPLQYFNCTFFGGKARCID